MKRFKSFLIIFVFLFILGIVFSLLIYNSISFIFILFDILESLFLASFLCLITCFKNDKINKLIKIIILGIITVFFIAQYVHYSFYDCFFSVYSLVNGGQVFGFINAIIKEILDHIWGILIILGLFGFTSFSIIKTNDYIDKKRFWSLLITSTLSIVIIFLSLFINIKTNNDIYCKTNLLNKTNSEVKNNKDFGLIGGMVIDLYRYNNSYDEDILKENDTKYVFKEKDNTKYNVTNINFNEITSSNSKVKKLNSYFMKNVPTNKNAYTGVFKDKNLIFVTAESLYFRAIDKKLTPTLYKMINNSLEFTNFYTPIYYASTSDGEYTNLTGVLPREGTWSYIASQNNVYPYTYSKMLKKRGYKTYSYHDGKYNFYNRDIVMPNFGFDKYMGCGNGLEKKINCDLWPQSDEEMFKETFNDYKDSKNFMTYYMSISSHLSHDFDSNDMAKKHKKEVNNLSYSTHVKAYISALIDLDKAMESLLNNLEKNNLIDDTVIVIVPDHYPYGLSDEELNEIEPLNNPYDKYKSGLIIYNSSLKHERINKYASNIDILPTLLNMFELNYDSRVIIGKDIMSNSEGIVIFNDRSFLTDKGYYNEKKNKFIYLDDSTTKQYINNKRIESFNKTNASSILLDTNYYKYIEKYIENTD